MRTPVALLLAVVVVFPAFAQQPRAQALPPNDESTTLFRGLFHFHKIEPEGASNVLARNDYSNLIVVVLCDPKNQNVVNICRSTIRSSGAVLIAADTNMSAGTFFPDATDITITGGRVLSSRPEGVDNDQTNRPLVQPVSSTDLNPFTGTRQVATNQPSFLIPTKLPPGFRMRTVAEFPRGTTVVQSERVVPGLGQLPLPFALATEDRGSLRCMVLADPDVFSNRMIYTSGRAENATDNLKFANNTVQWLKGNGRTRCLFIDRDGKPAQRFDEFQFSSIPLGPQVPPPPIPNIDITDPELQKGLTDAVNQTVDRAQQNDVMNRGILNAFQGRKSVLLAVLAVILLLLTYVVFRFRTIVSWYRRRFRPIPRDPAMIGPDVPVGSLEHRRLELLRSADYGPVVRPVVRQLFQDRGLPAEYTGDKLPPMDIDVRRPEFLREAIRSLWVVLHTTAPLGYGRWKQLEPQLAAVRAAADDDRWRFVAS